ncbi:MAG: class I SAM-dependent methyltransferase [Armatimonadetes bacterium]|nr:class I SAM-dependent methyltransferase [Armatimonadota bacterium]
MFHPQGPSFLELVVQCLSSTARGYDLLAPKFDLTPFRTPDEVLKVAVSEIGSAGAALDVCCGTGAAMRALRPICRERVVGVDFSLGMLEVARQRTAGAEGSARLEFVEGDVLEMSFREEFDLAVCFGAFGHILPRDEPRFVLGIHRSLKPGGRFVFVSSRMPPLLSTRALKARLFNGAMRVRNFLVRPPFIMYYLTFLLPEAQRLLERSGFEVEVRPGLFGAPFDALELVVARA